MTALHINEQALEAAKGKVRQMTAGLSGDLQMVAMDIAVNAIRAYHAALPSPSVPGDETDELVKRPALLDEIERGLEGVTPGPWSVREDKSGTIGVTADIGRRTLGLNYYPEDAVHIARLSPDNVRTILDYIASLATRISSDAAKLAEAGRRIAELEAGLEFYADPNSYLAILIVGDPPCGEFINDYSFDAELGREVHGRAARNLLNGGENGK